MFVRKNVWNAISKIFADHRELRVSTINVESGELGVVAEIFRAVAAVVAGAVRGVQPGNADPVAFFVRTHM